MLSNRFQFIVGIYQLSMLLYFLANVVGFFTEYGTVFVLTELLYAV